MVMQGIRDIGAEFIHHPVADHTLVKHAWALTTSGFLGSSVMWINGHLSTIQGWIALAATVIGAGAQIYSVVVKARIARRLQARAT